MSELSPEFEIIAREPVPGSGRQFCGHPDCQGHGPREENAIRFTVDHSDKLKMNAGVTYGDH
jgi:hypothetical protein